MILILIMGNIIVAWFNLYNGCYEWAILNALAAIALLTLPK